MLGINPVLSYIVHRKYAFYHKIPLGEFRAQIKALCFHPLSFAQALLVSKQGMHRTFGYESYFSEIRRKIQVCNTIDSKVC